MRLQRLEIAGFKSFSDRSELAFDEGVTAIVGPNGCGKSNVADAITWVLGEQSAKSLRGERMEDVIFGGSDARKPTGSAEVRLKLAGVKHLEMAGANGNGHAGHANGNGAGNGSSPSIHLDLVAEATMALDREVEVIRRLYRSGESEYLIDGQQCRLKDVHELLMDTGLGAKAYAIIEQGKIGMILSSRPADRRHLIEEAAGITKYKARRRSAELKLEAAQQNLTRVDDIVFEVEKQRGTLRRQAAKARRYQRLRDELRRWEKVLVARRSRELAVAIDAARAQLTTARRYEGEAAGRVGALEETVSRLRAELTEAEGRATAAREAAHARELEAQRRQQQVELDRQQASALDSRSAELDADIASLEARREPGLAILAERQDALGRAESELQDASAALAAAQEAYQAAGRELEGLESDVEAARNDVFAAINGATALRHVIQHATTARERVTDILGRLDVEESDLAIEQAALAASRSAAERSLSESQGTLESARTARLQHESALAGSRAEHGEAARDLKAREHALAGQAARLRSLEELDAARAGYSDAARVVLAEANGRVSQLGAVADYLDVDRRYERAVEAALGDRLQHVIVPTHGHAEAGLRLVREHDAGRCGFLVLEGLEAADDIGQVAMPEGLQALNDVARPSGPHAEAIGRALGRAWIAESFGQAVHAARSTGALVATLEGDVVQGAHTVFGGAAAEARGILATKGEIRELRERIAAERDAVAASAAAVAVLERTIADLLTAIESCSGDLHRQEKAIVGYEAQLARATEESERLARRSEMLALDRRRARDEGTQLDERQAEATAAIAQLEVEQRVADDRLNAAQRRVFEARETAGQVGQRVAEARATHARLTERASALASEVARLADSARELDERLEQLRQERFSKHERRVALLASVAEGTAQIDADARALDALRGDVRAADEIVSGRHDESAVQEHALRDARAALDTIRSEVGELDLARVTAESDLNHLAMTCQDTLQAPLAEVVAEVEALEQHGAVEPDAQAIAAVGQEDDAEDPGLEGAPAAEEAAVPPAGSLTADEAIAALRGKIDRLGPVNMMAIEQFEELESRHTFLTVQRKDLVDSIAQTGEAIKRIDETSKVRFREAFTAINQNFHETFSTLFGGGRAGITLLDEQDPLESGIDIVASPPGKRLQNVQLLSGGEKALTAIALMFAIFQYKPSPFCLLDEIDAPLDDANIGRFVEMLKGMLHHTQFILITHNRKTMEIADRLYGVTMEEPGVSKLISVRLN